MYYVVQFRKLFHISTNWSVTPLKHSKYLLSTVQYPDSSIDLTQVVRTSTIRQDQVGLNCWLWSRTPSQRDTPTNNIKKYQVSLECHSPFYLSPLQPRSKHLELNVLTISSSELLASRHRNIAKLLNQPNIHCLRHLINPFLFIFAWVFLNQLLKCLIEVSKFKLQSC